MVQNFGEMAALAKERQVSLAAIILENEIKSNGTDEAAVYAGLAAHYEVMKSSAGKALEQVLPIECPLIEGNAQRQFQYYKTGNTISGDLVNHVMARALSGSEVNASMGKVCAAPTAGASGILPAVLLTLAEKYRLEERAVLDGLLVASGIGAVIMESATVSGAEGGCQAECGVAAAMAAGAAVHLAGGGEDVPLHAAAFALINAMGLICDPVAGLVQVPSRATECLSSGECPSQCGSALAGMRSIIPLDEVVEAISGRQADAGRIKGNSKRRFGCNQNRTSV